MLIWKKRSSGKKAEGLGQLLVQAILLFSHSFNQSIESHSFSMRIVTMLVEMLTRKENPYVRAPCEVFIMRDID